MSVYHCFYITINEPGGTVRPREQRGEQGNVPLKRQELVASNVELVALLEGSGHDAVLRLDGEEDLVQRAEDLVDFADDGLLGGKQVWLAKCPSFTPYPHTQLHHSPPLPPLPPSGSDLILPPKSLAQN